TTVTQQAARQKALKQFTAQEQDAATRLAEARQALTNALARPSPTPAPSPSASPSGETPLDAQTQQRVRELNTRQLAWQVFLAGLRIEQLAVDKVVLNLESAAADAIIPVLQEYSSALADFRGRVARDSAQEQREEIERELAAATTDYGKAYWRVRQAIMNGRWKFGTQIPGLRDQLRDLEGTDLAHDIELISDRYKRLLERLDRTTGAEKTDAYHQLTQYIEDYDRRREEYAIRLDQARRELEQMYEQKEAVLDSLKEADEELRAALPKIDTAEERARYDQLMAELAADHRPALDSVISAVIERQTLIINRLSEMLAQLQTFNTHLEQTRQKLFWAYTLARGPHVIQLWRTALDRFSLGELRSDLTRAATTSRERLQRHDRSVVILWSLSLVVAAIGGVLLARRLWRASDVHEEKVSAKLAETEAAEVHLNDRVHIQVLRMLAMVVPVGIPTLLALFFAWQDNDLSADLRAVVIRLLVVILVATVTRALIKRLFRSGKPRYRIIPCSNVVASYYRFWLSALWWLTMPVITVVMVMEILDLAPHIAEAIRTTFIALALLVLVIFARHRQTVVRVMGRAFALRRPLFFGFIMRSYPFMLLLCIALFVLEVIGYDALATFIILNLMHTFAALVLAALIASMLHDFIHRRTASGEGEDAGAEETTGASKEYGIDEMLRQYETREWGLMLTSLAAIGQWVVWLGALAWVATAWGMTETNARQLFAYELVAPPADSGRLPITVGRVLLGLLVIFLAFKISQLVVRTLTNKIYPVYGHVNKAAQATINTLLRYTLVTVGIYIGLRVMHIELGALVVLLGGLGLGLGLGLQPLIVNFVSGLIIFAERHVKVGDLVMVGDDLGEVTAISIRSTRVRSVDGIDLVIPNSDFVTSKVVNWTLQDSRIRGKLDVGVAYGSDVQKVRQILLEVARKEARVLLDPEPAVWFTNFGNNSLDFTLACWYPTAGDRWFAMIDMRYEIDRRFREAGIEIPFPQRTLSVHPDAELPIRVLRERRPAKAAPAVDEKPAEPAE
ncbi:MAG TPA: mechanosensitive ion channel, partial [Phycisphaerae bacterium]|nr:mechanosensitive ion channel [Phycisphaerae bacterium]